MGAGMVAVKMSITRQRFWREFTDGEIGEDVVLKENSDHG
jgi:hypothetical protein